MAEDLPDEFDVVVIGTGELLDNIKLTFIVFFTPTDRLQLDFKLILRLFIYIFNFTGGI